MKKSIMELKEGVEYKLEALMEFRYRVVNGILETWDKHLMNWIKDKNDYAVNKKIFIEVKIMKKQYCHLYFIKGFNLVRNSSWTSEAWDKYNSAGQRELIQTLEREI